MPSKSNQVNSIIHCGVGECLQKMWASSCWNRLTRVNPVKAPLYSFLCSTPKSASLRGSSLQDRARWPNITQWPAQEQ